MADVLIKNVTKIYDKNKVIDNVSLELVNADGIVDDSVEIEIPKVKVNQMTTLKMVFMRRLNSTALIPQRLKFQQTICLP